MGHRLSSILMGRAPTNCAANDLAATNRQFVQEMKINEIRKKHIVLKMCGVVIMVTLDTMQKESKCHRQTKQKISCKP